ncbi:uncharacterized protein LOC116112257 [Pistacia vera]|uniref:uncharacterized protein LOC116112257 n=1 Tax=Pistacia vera TaxID=55513 RepID=UPI001263B13A|nr:uncharacterized protein LOC116112257 [Pistacia vera]
MELLKRGHLRDFLTDNGKNIVANKEHQITPPPKAPPTDRMCSVISGTSEVSGVTYSAAKCHAKSIANQVYHLTQQSLQKPTNLTIEFVEDEATSLHNPHHNALIITFQIANIIVKRILVDPSSSANILFLEAFKVIGSDKSSINYRPTLLRFSLEQKYTFGGIALLVYAEGINLQTTFIIVDAPSPYNIIMGRPCVHDMTGLSPNAIVHQLNVDLDHPSVKQKRRKFAPKRNKVINKEVDKLLSNDSV